MHGTKSNTHSFKKNSQKLAMEENFLNLIKGIHKNSIANTLFPPIILNIRGLTHTVKQEIKGIHPR